MFKNNMDKLTFGIGALSAGFGAVLLTLLYLYAQDPDVAGIMAFFPFIGGVCLMISSHGAKNPASTISSK